MPLLAIRAIRVVDAVAWGLMLSVIIAGVFGGIPEPAHDLKAAGSDLTLVYIMFALCGMNVVGFLLTQSANEFTNAISWGFLGLFFRSFVLNGGATAAAHQTGFDPGDLIPLAVFGLMFISSLLAAKAAFRSK